MGVDQLNSAPATSASTVDSDAAIVFNYLQMNMSLARSIDAIFCLCSLDVRVAQRAAELFLAGLGAEYLIFSGGSGKLTAGRFDKPEAEVFAERARGMGVPPEKIIVENNSTNTGENIRFTWNLLAERGLSPKSFILVQKPYMERRTYATFKKQWPNPETAILVTSPAFSWSEYPDADNPRDLVINIMVGDLIRIFEYPAKGYQIPQGIPDEVWEAGQRLIEEGYTNHLP